MTLDQLIDLALSSSLNPLLLARSLSLSRSRSLADVNQKHRWCWRSGLIKHHRVTDEECKAD